MWRRRKCEHPPISDFVAFKGKRGATVWRCSHCGKEDVWRDGWQYYGPVECLGCGGSGARAVLCSDECVSNFKPSDPALRLELAKQR
jgi:hypothetical protein